MKNLKRIAGLTLAASFLGASAMAAPVNQMAAHETAIGANTKGAYVEHKVTGKATVGYEYMDRDEYNNQDAAYLQYDIIGSEVKAIGGYRWNLPGDKSNASLAEVSPMWEFDFHNTISATLGSSYFMRVTRYSYHKTVRANTFEIKLGVTCHF